MTLQRSPVAGDTKLVTLQGQTQSQLQFSKYVPSTFQAISSPLLQLADIARV
jgi:hypothetical protein